MKFADETQAGPTSRRMAICPLQKKPTNMFNPLKTVWFCWDPSPSILGTNLQWVNHSYLQIEGVFAQEDDQLPPPPKKKKKKKKEEDIWYIYQKIFKKNYLD